MRSEPPSSLPVEFFCMEERLDWISGKTGAIDRNPSDFPSRQCGRSPKATEVIAICTEFSPQRLM